MKVLSIFISLNLLVSACNKSKFKGGGAEDSAPEPTQTPTVEKPTEPKCTETNTTVGLNLVFVVDNSRSNVDTDPNAERIKSIVSIFNKLSAVEKQTPNAKSQISVVSFPEPYTNCKEHELKYCSEFWQPGQVNTSWLQVQKTNSSQIQSQLFGLNRPDGMTPFEQGLQRAFAKFSENSLPKENKNLVILITDGEPTDIDPQGVLSQSLQQLKTKNIALYAIQTVPTDEVAANITAFRSRLIQEFGYSEEVVNGLLGSKGDGTDGLMAQLANQNKNRFNIDNSAQLSEKISQLVQTEKKCI